MCRECALMLIACMDMSMTDCLGIVKDRASHKSTRLGRVRLGCICPINPSQRHRPRQTSTRTHHLSQPALRPKARAHSPPSLPASSFASNFNREVRPAERPFFSFLAPRAKVYCLLSRAAPRRRLMPSCTPKRDMPTRTVMHNQAIQFGPMTKDASTTTGACPPH